MTFDQTVLHDCKAETKSTCTWCVLPPAQALRLRIRFVCSQLLRILARGVLVQHDSLGDDTPYSGVSYLGWCVMNV